MTEEAFTIVAMAYVTPEAMKMKVKFINEFKRMREQLQNSKVRVLDDRTAFIQSLRLTAETAERQDEMEKILLQHDQKILQIESKVDEQITLDYAEQRRLQKEVAKRVYYFTEDKKEASRLFKELYREIKDRFGVSSYKDVKRKDLNQAIQYVGHWVPRKVS